MTLAEQVALQLAIEIVTGSLLPGSRLDEKVQSARLRVSRTPLREALCQLTSMGLAHSRSHCGVFVVDGAGLALLQAVEELIGARLSVHLAQATPDERRQTANAILAGSDWGARLMRGSHNPILSRIGLTLWHIFDAIARVDQAGAVRASLAKAVEDGDGERGRIALRAYLSAVSGCVEGARAA
ncbi:hypothetical protein MTBLM5_10284 [Magnetospirillum sp. LM-5]|uniref:GntR family transcriptional regulator n=1 Tax=Magnetospirillum sp. LM-5 TaxID=2681466 RepID=UPI00137E98C0|nr:GntR family transcriptional regulator [Magnetospirillum sp. LM-5]CAA7612020.1 hypothetical protein MTBLM5_10284 [Magnetospirillum sp. LM-5]